MIWKSFLFAPRALLFFSSTILDVQATEATRLPFIIDMVHDNPGEGTTPTKWRDPGFVKTKGIDAMAPHWLVQAALTYDALPEGGVPEGEERIWIEQHAEKLRDKMREAEAAGVDVYPWTDFLVIPASIWARYGERMGSLEGKVHAGGSEGRSLKPDIQSEWTQRIVRAQVNEFFDRFPEADGLTLRFGETYLHDAPHHVGGSPIGDKERAIKDHITLIGLLREEICEKRGKKLIYRTWSFDGFHAKPEFYLAVTDAIEPHPNLLYSIKHTRGDFHRRMPFNPCLGIGKHKQIVEVSCQPEYYGKQAHPNYIANGVIEGWEEFRGQPGKQGLRDLLDSGLLAGVTTWSRGGGWDGPYIKSEFWADLNTLVLTRWALDPKRSEEEIFYEVATAEFGFSEADAKRLRTMALDSATAVLKGRLSRVGEVDHLWTRDHYISGLARPKFRQSLERILAAGKAEDAIAEKLEAVELWRKIENDSTGFTSGSDENREYLRVSATYGRILHDIFAQSWIVLFELLKHEKGQPVDKPKLAEAVARYDQLWEEFRALKAKEPLCATLYTEDGFRGDAATGIGAEIQSAKAQLFAPGTDTPSRSLPQFRNRTN